MLSTSATVPQTFRQYYRRVLVEAPTSTAKWGRDNLVVPIGFVLGSALISFALFGQSIDWRGWTALFWMNGIALTICAAVALLKAPKSLDAHARLEIEELRRYRQTVEDREVKLKLSEHTPFIVRDVHHVVMPGGQPVKAYSLLVVFANPVVNLP
jgi:MFS family permease